MKKPVTEQPGISLELVVAKIQQMMDPGSEVSHNERIVDRVGNLRQYDVVIRGKFGGRSVLGVVECKDHSRKKGPSTIEAFAKKTENLGANLRLIVSRKGFTKQALNLAKHENVGCLSLLPDNPEQVGFSIGDMWYGIIDLWINLRLRVHFATDNSPSILPTFNASTVKWEGKPVINWFMRELYTTYKDEKYTECGKAFTLTLEFDKPRNIEIEGGQYLLSAISCQAEKVQIKKKKWVFWSGDAFYDWHTKQFTIPPKGTIVGSAVESDLREWDDYDGELPDLSENQDPGFLKAIMYNKQKWDESKNIDTPDLSKL
jgi:Restriction endonuclease